MSEICPRCSQGELVHATIMATGEEVIVCDDCEALWKQDAIITTNNFVDMFTYLRSQGLKDGWKELHCED